MTIRHLNTQLRSTYEGARSIRHYQGVRHDETQLTTDQMPNTQTPGRIFVGYTDELRTARA